MRATPLALTAGLLHAATASPVNSRQVTDTPCHKVHIFVARGSYEGYDLSANRQDNLLVPEVCNGRASCGYEDIVYPATIGDDYCGSETQGVNNGLSQLKAYADKCPDSKIVLTGYSQGAQVIGDMLSGGGGSSCAAGNGALSPNSSPGNKIAAVTLFADTRRTPNQSYDYGTAGEGAVGAFPREGAALDALNKYADKMQSYCGANDTWCASGTDGNVHSTSVETYHGYASDFINAIL